MGISNTVATIPGVVSPTLAGALTTNVSRRCCMPNTDDNYERFFVTVLNYFVFIHYWCQLLRSSVSSSPCVIALCKCFSLVMSSCLRSSEFGCPYCIDMLIMLNVAFTRYL